MGFIMRTALTASTLLLAAGSTAAEPFHVIAQRSPSKQYVACYDSKDGLTNQTSYEYQSSGWCQNYCLKTNAAVFAMIGGSDCLCGEELPPSASKVSDSKCNTKCDGWPTDMCGGSGVWSVWLTGLDSHVSSEGASTTSSSGNLAQQTDNSMAASSEAQQVTVTAPVGAQNDGSSGSSSSPNTAAIAAGVVVGVVGFAALVGAAFFFYRHKKRKEDDGHGGGAGDFDSRPPAMSDSRFDGNYMAQRRQSNGSIDDDHDFSRRILQITNPDRF